MASKYADVIGGLDPLPPEEPEYQAKIQTVKDQIGILPAETLGEMYEIARRGELDEPTRDTFIDGLADTIQLLGKEGVEEILSRINLRIAAMEQLLSESYDREEDGWGLYGGSPTTVRLPNGTSISVQPEPSAKVLDKEVFRLWCIRNGLEGSLQLHPSTAIALAKERLLAGEPDPDGMKTYSRVKVVMRKGK